MDYFNTLKEKKKKEEVEEFNQMYFFPSEKILKENDVVYQHIIQKPGDGVYTGYGSIHWVYNPVSFYFSFNNSEWWHSHRLEPSLVQ